MPYINSACAKAPAFAHKPTVKVAAVCARGAALSLVYQNTILGQQRQHRDNKPAKRLVVVWGIVKHDIVASAGATSHKPARIGAHNPHSISDPKTPRVRLDTVSSRTIALDAIETGGAAAEKLEAKSAASRANIGNTRAGNSRFKTVGNRLTNALQGGTEITGGGFIRPDHPTAQRARNNADIHQFRTVKKNRASTLTLSDVNAVSVIASKAHGTR
jgi:hypothetical protein